ncbi:MAG: helix-turn-helix transcriptional regulator [Streptomycetaceae bacterium]|nr:helix-turn-helix transcriptional regulator [Streptomycetaceae bacterium]
MPSPSTRTTVPSPGTGDPAASDRPLTDREIGAAIRTARQRSGWSQAALGQVLGYAKSTISRMETGKVHIVIGQRLKIAEVLGIDPRLLGAAVPDPPDPPRGAPGTARTVRRRTLLAAGAAAAAAPAAGALHTLTLALVADPQPAYPAQSLEQLARDVGRARALFTTCRYTDLETFLTGLLTALRHAADNDGHGPYSSALLATTYQTAAATLLKLGELGGAQLAATWAMTEAGRHGDPTVTASSTRVQAHTLVRAGHAREAAALVRYTADPLLGAYDRRSPRELAALGLLLLRGSTAAAAAGDQAGVAEFLAEARDVARHVDTERPDAWANFSTTNVDLHALSAHAAMHETGRGLDLARALAARPIPIPERLAALGLETARLHAQSGRPDLALSALRRAEAAGGEDLRRRPAVHQLLADLAASDRGRRMPELRTLQRAWRTP